MSEGGSRRARKVRGARRVARPSVWPGMEGGGYAPLSESACDAIHALTLEILDRIGLSDAPPALARRVARAGASLGDDGRLRFPPAMIARALADLGRPVLLAGRDAAHDLTLRGARVHMGSGGAAPMVVDLASGRHRASTLADLHDAARLADALSNVHFFSRSLVARDMPTARVLDLNTAYACLAGTSKHVCVSASDVAHVADIAALAHAAAGGAAAFAERPCLSLNVNHVAPPLRFAPEACRVLEAAVEAGLPVHANVFAQVGASCPVSPEGAVAQCMAEALAGVALAWAVSPEARVVAGPRPMIVDLRTGAMSGGGGEQAVMSAAATQIARRLGLPNSCIAGASDAKLADAQSGYEKALTVSAAAHAGCNMITQSAGMQAALMAASFESYVIDDDMIGHVLSMLRPVSLGEADAALAEIERVARGDGHFLGESATLARMESDFFYPRIADRRSIDDWAADGAEDQRAVARRRATEILATHTGPGFDPKTDAALRARFEIATPPQTALANRSA